MFSILIPTYNYNVTKLAGDLHRQAKSLGVDFEIVVAEDGSQRFLKENAEVGKMDFVRHLAFENNVGRGRHINRMADRAKFNNLLIMDCDAVIVEKDYLKNYMPYCNEKQLVNGGILYDVKDDMPQYRLRYLYGIKRDAISAHQRNQNPYNVFITSNILIDKDLFQKVRFNEKICDYGSEDTIFRHDFLELNYPVVHIDNPIIHSGLADNFAFLKNTEKALANLFLLYSTGQYPTLTKYSKLLVYFLKIKKYRLQKTVAFFFKMSEKLLVRNLTGKNPSLFLFDLYKLGFLCKIATRN